MASFPPFLGWAWLSRITVGVLGLSVMLKAILIQQAPCYFLLSAYCVGGPLWVGK